MKFFENPRKMNKYKCNAPAAAKLLQSCLTLCDPTDRSPPGSPVSGILQARTLEWVAISFSNAWKWKVKVKSLSCVRLLATPWTAAYQAPLSVRFFRQEYWSGVPLPSPTGAVEKYQNQITSFSVSSWLVVFVCVCVCVCLCVYTLMCKHVQTPVCTIINPKAKIPINWYFAQQVLYVNFLILHLAVILTL